NAVETANSNVSNCQVTSHAVSVLLMRAMFAIALFPYTTLFRSAVFGCCQGMIDATTDSSAIGAAPIGRDGTRARVCARADRAGIDRKSTRLNSSHVSISYAVFCLKKKKYSSSNYLSISSSITND